ncbi:MAG: hypothetical protein ACLQT6_01590 [Desulfomonilaceae bacterium]
MVEDLFLEEITKTAEPLGQISLKSGIDARITYLDQQYDGKADVLFSLTPNIETIVRFTCAKDDLLKALNSHECLKLMITFPSLGVSARAFPKIMPGASNPDGSFSLDLIPFGSDLRRNSPKKKQISRLSFCLLNFHEFRCFESKYCRNHSVVKGDSSHVVLQGIGLTTKEWTIQLSELSWSKESFSKLRQGSGYSITHFGGISRNDEDSFSLSRAHEILDALHFFFSFARGMWTAPVLAKGTNKEGEIVWEQFDVPRCDRWQCSPTWFDPSKGEMLGDVFAGFWEKWEDKKWNDALRNSIDWYLTSKMGQVDAGLVIAQAALELLSWVYFAGNKALKDLKSFDDLPAAFRIKSILCEADISRKVPSTMKRLAEKICDNGPEAITTLRNQISHPKGTTSEGTLLLRIDALKLSQWYVELILLWLCSYNGDYASTLKIQIPGQVEKVPWAE